MIGMQGGRGWNLMRISRIEIFGFKSFMDRFVLNFDKNLIGVVGPNGCGKSNIVDALCWVLGETHARHLRGNVLDDIIFNGTQLKRPLGMAEVSITIRPDEGWSPALTQTEIGVLADQELSALQQSLDVLTSQTGDIKQEGKSEASKQQDALPQNGAESQSNTRNLASLGFFPTLLDASEIQLTRRLYRSGESEYFINRVPCRLRDMLDLYRAIGLGARGLSIVQQGQIGEIIGKKPITRRELLEEAAGISGIRTRIEAAQRKLEKTETNMSRLRDLIGEVEKNVSVLKRQARRAERRGQLKADLKRADLDLFQTKASRTVLRCRDAMLGSAESSEHLEKEKNKFSLLSAEQEQVRSFLETAEVALEDARRKRNNLIQEISQEGERENSIRLELVRVQGELLSAKNELTHLCGRRVTIGDEIASRDQARQGAGENLSSWQRRRREIDVVLDSLLSLTEREDVVLQEMRRYEILLSEKEREIRELTKKMTLQGEDLVSGLEDGEVSEQTLFSLITVPDGLERAVSAVLGEAGSCVVSARLEEHAAEHVRLGQQSAIRGVLSPNSRLNSWPVSYDTGSASVPSLCDMIQTNESYKNILQAIIGDVYLCDSLSQGLLLQQHASQLQEQAGRHERESFPIFVTRQGEVVTHWGWYVSEGEGLRAFFRETLRERTQEVANLRIDLDRKKSSLRELRSETESVFETPEGKPFEQILREVSHRTMEHGSSASFNRICRESLQRELSRVSTEMAKVESLLRFEGERVGSLQSELKHHEDRARQIELSIDQLQKKEDQLTAEGKAIISSGAGDTRDHLKRELLVYDAEVHQFEAKKDSLKLQLATMIEEVEVARGRLEKISQEQRDCSLQIERCELELGLILEDVRKSYEEAELPTEDQAYLMSQEIHGDFEAQVSRLEDECRRIRGQLEREGEVDEQSIELYKHESARLEEMKLQHEDLEKAFQILDTTIKRLKGLSRVRFLETFASVNEKFSELVPRLFGGGAGRLELIDPSDPLTSGVEIIVRPPGKKIRDMDMLSGGEKALSAAAILVAMFLHRPSPICVLDEVDAPLDDANLERFLSLIREISKTTQFLVITHNKQSMAAVDKLVGITMQEQGVSTGLQVSLETAEEQFAVNA